MRPAKGVPIVSPRAEMARHTIHTPKELVLMRGELPQTFAASRRRPDPSHRPASAGPTMPSAAVTNQGSREAMQQRLVLSPRAETPLLQAVPTTRPVRAASAAPTRPQHQANPRNLLRPKSSTAQRKLLQTAEPDPIKNHSDSDHGDRAVVDALQLHRPATAAPALHKNSVAGSNKRFKIAAVAIGMAAKSASVTPEVATPEVDEAPDDKLTARQMQSRDALRILTKRKPREQLTALLQSPESDTFRYAVPAHQLQPFARYDPYTLVDVPFPYVYASHLHDTKPDPVQFTSDDRIIDTHIKCDFYVIHATGLLFYCKTNATVEYQSMADWDRERRVFKAVSDIALFRKYRGLKALVCWKRYYLRNKFAKAQSAIEHQLYFCNPVLLATMTHIRHKLLPFQTMHLFEPTNSGVKAPDVFVHTQKQRVVEAAKHLADICSWLRDLLSAVAKEYLSQYSTTESVITHAETCFTSRKSTVFHVDQLRRISSASPRHGAPKQPASPLANGVDVDLQAIRTELQRNRFRYQVSEARRTHAPAVDEVKWSIAAVKRAKCLELAHFITRVDLMLLDIYQDVIVRSAHNLVQVLEIGAGAKGPTLLLSKDAYMKAYRRFDTFGTESMNTAQLTRLLQFVFDGKLQGAALDNRVEAFIAVFDSNGDGDISLDEFSHGLDILLDEERMQALDPDSMSVFESSQKIDMFRPEPLFTVHLGLDGNDKLTFEPTLGVVSQSVHATLNGFFDVCAHVQRLVEQPVLLPYLTFAYEVRSTEIGAAEPPDRPATRVPTLLMERADQDASYLALCSKIEEVLKDSTCAAIAYSKCFEGLRAAHVQNNMIDFDALAAQHRTGAYALQVMQTDIARYQKEQADLETLVQRQDIQLIRVQTSGLKEQFLPSPARCLHEYARILPVLAESNCKELLSYIETASIKIQRPATKTLDAFVSYLLNLQEVSNDLLTKDHDAVQITSYFDVLRAAGFAIPDHAQASYDLCGPELSTLKANATTCLAKRDMDIREYAVLLSQSIDHLEANIEYLQTEACSDQVCDGGLDCDKALAFTQRIQDAALDHELKAKRFVYIRSLFNSFLANVLPESPLFQSLPHLIHDITLKHDVWALIAETEETLARWGPTALKDLPMNEMRLLLEQLTDILARMVEKYANLLVTRRLSKLQSYLAHITPTLQDLCSEHLEERHWQRLENKLQVKFEYEVDAFASTDTASAFRHTEISFQYFMSLGIEDAKDDIHEVVQEAVTEAAIGKSLEEAIKVWETKDIPFVPRLVDHETREILVLGNTSEVLAMLEESDVLLQTIMGSSYIRPIQSIATKWRDEVTNMIDLMTRLDECHRYWDHMEAFLSSEFMRALPDQAQSYGQLEKTWRALVDKISKNPSLLRTARATGVKEQLTALTHGFNAIYKLLEGYLQLKRQNFPRFYVLSDAELAELIAQCREPRNIQKYLHCVFPCIARLEFGLDERSQDIVAAHSPALPFREVISLGKNLKARGYIEQWVSAVHRRLHERVQKMVRDLVPFWLGHTESAFDVEALKDAALQSVLVANDIATCHTIAHAVARQGACQAAETLGAASKTHAARLHELAASAVTQTSRHGAVLVSSLLLQQLYYRDVIAGLGQSHGKEHMRYSLQEDTGDVFVEWHDVRVPYGFTYYSPSHQPLVLAPLTARYHVALFTAMRSFHTTLVTGPCIGGKSTLVQMLSRALGRELLQTHCSSFTRQGQLEQLVAGGLLLSGTLLLRNVDTLAAPVLQFLAQTISTLVNHAMAKRHHVVLDDREVHFSLGAHIVLTSNVTPTSPAASAAFRAIAERTLSLSVVPMHVSTLFHSLLYSHGWSRATELANKLACVWHEFRAVVSRELPSLLHATTLRVAVEAVAPLLHTAPDVDDRDQLVQTTLVTFFTARVHPHSEDLHAHLAAFVKSVWFMAPPPRPSDPALVDESEAVEAPPVDPLAASLAQAYYKHHAVLTPQGQTLATATGEALAHFRCVVVTGAPKSGKTTTVHLLAHALNCFLPCVHDVYPSMAAWGGVQPADTRFVRIKRLLPAALSLDRLYGTSGDAETSILKHLLHEPAEASSCHFVPESGPLVIEAVPLPVYLQHLLAVRQRVWVCLDGPLGGPWVDHLLGVASCRSSLLHQFPERWKDVVTCEPHVSIVFETIELLAASPSLVANVGLIHVADAPGHAAVHHQLLEGYLRGFAARPGVPMLVAEACSKYLGDRAFIDRLLECQFQGKSHYELQPVHSVQNVLALLQAQLTSHPAIPFHAIFQASGDVLLQYTAKVELVVLWSLAWGLGAALDVHTKRMLSSVLESHFRHLQDAWSTNGLHVSLYDCLLDVTTLRFRRGRDHLLPPNATQNTPLFAVYLPRVASTLVHAAAKQAFRGGLPVLVCGAPDAGSSSCVHDLLQRLSAFAARGLSTLDAAPTHVAEEKTRVANMRMSTTLLVSSMAGRMKRRIHAAKGDPSRRDSVYAKATAHVAGDNMCNHVDGGNLVAAYVPCSASMTSSLLEAYLERTMQRERRSVLEPPPGKTMVLFLDDVHVPMATHPSVHATLRSILDLRQVYLGTEVEPHSIESTLLVATAPLSYTSSLGGSVTSAARLLGRFFPIVLEAMTPTDLYHLIQPVFAQHFERQDMRYALAVRQQVPVIAAITIDLFVALQTKAPVFGLRSLFEFLQQLVRPSPTAITDVHALVRLWHHESVRTFVDATGGATAVASEIDHRLALLRDRAAATAFVNDAIWSFAPHVLVTGAMSIEARARARRQSSSSLLAPTAVAGLSASEPFYEELARGDDSIESDTARLHALLAPHVPASFILMPSAVASVAPRAVLSSALGRATAAAAGGGKRSTVEAAATLMGHTVLHYVETGEPTRWKATLQRAVRLAGVEQRDVSLIIESVNVFSNAQVADLVQLMLGRVVPLLFSAEEQDRLAQQVKEDKLAEMTALHCEQLKQAKINALAEKQNEVQRAVDAGSYSDASLAQLEARWDAKIQRGLDALVNVQHGETDDLLRQFEANVDVNMAIVLPIAKSVGVLSGIWNDILRAAGRNLRVAVLLTPASKQRLVEQAPKLASACPVAMAPAPPPATVQAVVRAHVYREWVAAELRLPGTCSEAELNVLATIGAMCHVTSAAMANADVAMHAIPRFARQVFLSLAHIRAEADSCMVRPRRYLRFVELLQVEVDKAKATESALIADIEAKTAAIAAQKNVLSTHQSTADHLRAEMRQQKLDVDAHVASTNEMDRSTQAELRDALQMLDDANAAVAALDKRYIIEIKSFIHPPMLVHLVLNAVCVVFGVEPSWDNARRLLSDVNFVVSMINYDKDAVPDRVLENLEPYIADPLFTRDEVEKQSIAASTMVTWIVAIHAYARVRTVIKPKLDVLNAAQANLRGLVKAFTDCKQQLDVADQAATNLEKMIQVDMQTKKELQDAIESVRHLSRQGSMVLALLAVETAYMTATLDAMVEMEATILVEAAVAAAVVVYASGFPRDTRAILVEHWRQDLAARDIAYRSHPTISILSDSALPPWGRWLQSMGLFHSRMDQAIALTIAYAQGVLVLANFSTEMDTLLNNVLAVRGLAPETRFATDRDFDATVEACITSGTPLVVHGLTPAAMTTILANYAKRADTTGSEHRLRAGIHSKFRFIFTSYLGKEFFGHHDGIVLDSKLVLDNLHTTLVDDMCRSNVGNASSPGAAACVAALVAGEADLHDAQDNVILQLRDVLASLKFTALELEKLKDICAHNARVRESMTSHQVALDAALAVYRSPSCQALARLGANVYTALSPVAPLSLNGFRKLFSELLMPDKWRSADEWLVLALDRLVVSMPPEAWTSFLWRLAFWLHSESAPSAGFGCSSSEVAVSTATDGFLQLQVDMLLPPSLAAHTSPDALKLLQACSNDDVMAALQSQQPAAKRRRQRPVANELTDSVAAYLASAAPSVEQLVLLLRLLWPTERLSAWSAQFVLDTLKLARLEPRLTPSAWYQRVGARDSWCRVAQSRELPTTRQYLGDVLQLTIPMPMQYKVLHSLLQRMPLATPDDPFALTHYDLGHNQTLVCFDSVHGLLQADEATPLVLTQFAWRCVYVADPDHLTAYTRRYRLDDKPVGVVADEIETKALPPEGSALHVFPINSPMPRAIDSSFMALAPPRMSALGSALRDNLLHVVSLPFSASVADVLQTAPLSELGRSTVGILVWRVLSGVCFFHAVLLVRQRTVVGALADHDEFDPSDVTLAVVELMGPILQGLVRLYARYKDGPNPYSGVDWPALRLRLLQRVYARKQLSIRFSTLLDRMLCECVGPALVAWEPSAAVSSFHLPLPAFYSLFHDRQVATSEDYLRLLCEFAATATLEFSDVRPCAEPTIPDVLHHLLATDDATQASVMSKFADFVQALCARIPPPLVLKLHPRNASKPTPLRYFAKSVVRAYERDVAAFTAALQALIPLAGKAWNELTEDHRTAMVQLLQDRLPPRMVLASLDAGQLSLSGYLNALARQAAFLQSWWDEEHVEYWCPAIDTVNELVAAFLVTYGVLFNRDVSQIHAVYEVYATGANVEPARRRHESMLLTGLALLNATPTPSHGVVIAAGQEVPVKVLVRVVEGCADETQKADACPVLRSHLNPVVIGTISLPCSMIESATSLPYLVLSPQTQSS
ncbi:dynein heavy chain 6, axonemal [Achlya hypogyna]|uniref:Dynein heavy chain 6, axonemal n=1 Tax=Achlya hypogyna TaxID=1202772 RepID=A0A1V9ZUD4_ACHHY|nr:dynein heavy chain 6, axonemal [Achlya hypogyna]